MSTASLLQLILRSFYAYFFLWIAEYIHQGYILEMFLFKKLKKIFLFLLLHAGNAVSLKGERQVMVKTALQFLRTGNKNWTTISRVLERHKAVTNLNMKQIMMQKTAASSICQVWLFATGKKICLSTYPNNWVQIFLLDPLKRLIHPRSL